MPNDILDAPCAICGYNGPGYWQRETHRRDCPWYYLGGGYERRQAVRALMPRMKDANEQKTSETLLEKVARASRQPVKP